LDQQQGKSGRGVGGFIAELKRRHVVRAGVAYAAVGFVVLQAAEIIREAWAFPEWVLRLVVVFTLLGFPLVLALAWVYELTPIGLRTMRELDSESGIPETAGLARIALLIVTVIAVGVSGWWWVRSNVGEAAAGDAADAAGIPATLTRRPGDPIRSLAVLPLQSFSQQQEGRDYFAEGMQEALISQLSQVEFVRVLSRTSSSQVDTRGKTAPQIGAELGVDALIEGSVLSADGRVRITVQLIEVATDAHLWAHNYERDLVDIIALQREVADSIVMAIRGELDPEALRAAQLTESVAAPTDPLATDAVMRGRMALRDVGGPAFRASSLDSAAQHFQEAIQRDPGYAAAFRGLAQVYALRALAASGPPAPADIRAASENAARAMELDPNGRETQEVVAQVGLLGPQAMMPDLPGGTFAMEVRPGSDSIGVVVIGNAEKPMVSMTEPGRQLQMAWARREADSESPGTQFRAARRFVSIGMPEEARDILVEVVREDPRNFPAWDELARIHRVLGDLDAVVDMWRARSDRAAGQGQGTSSAPSAESVQRLEQEVRRDSVEGYWRWRLRELRARSERGDRVSPMDFADAYAGLGQADAALDSLAAAADRGDPRVRTVRTDPVWDPFRRDPRYIAALAEADEFGPRPDSRGGGRGDRGGASDGGRGGGSGRGGGDRPDQGRSGGGRGRD
jgi:TolB-like protein